MGSAGHFFIGEPRKVGSLTVRTPILTDYLTIKDLAAELGVTRRTLNRWNQLREGPPITMIGGRIFYRREAVREWLLSREQRKAGAPQVQPPRP